MKILLTAGFAIALLPFAVGQIATSRIKTLNSHGDRVSAVTVLATAKALRRYVQDHRVALKAAVRSAPVVIPRSNIVGDYLAPEWSGHLPSGHDLVLAVVAATDGEPLGYVYAVGGGDGFTHNLGAAVSRGLPEAERSHSHWERWTAASSALLPTPATDGVILSTSQVRSPSLKGAVLRYREPLEGVVGIIGNLDVGGHTLRHVGTYTGQDFKVSGTIDTDAATAGEMIFFGVSSEGPQ
jgi:hypothetical protein